MPLSTYTAHFVLLYVSLVFLSVGSNAGTRSKIVRPSAVDFEVANSRTREGQRYRGGETASDRLRRKNERLKREQEVQRKRAFDELPNKVKNYNRREDNTRRHRSATKADLKTAVRDAEELEADATAQLRETRSRIHRINDEVYAQLNESVDEEDQRDNRDPELFAYRNICRTGVENRTLVFLRG